MPPSRARSYTSSSDSQQGVKASIRFHARRFQRRNGISNVRIESGTARIEVSEYLLAHPRIPEFADVVGDASDPLVVPLALEEFADLIGHIDQPVIMRHAQFLVRPPLTRCDRDG